MPPFALSPVSMTTSMPMPVNSAMACLLVGLTTSAKSVGMLVDKLSRTRFGTLDLTGLRPGESRRLNKKEISQLHNAAVNKVK